MFIRVPSRDRLLHSGFFGRAVGVIGFILVRWVHSGALVSVGSFRCVLRIVGFICVRWVHLGNALRWCGILGRRVHSVSLDSFGRGQPVAGFILVRSVHSVASWG